MLGAAARQKPGHSVVLAPDALELIAVAADSPQKKIQRFIELAILRCGSAAALARELGVKAPTVSQWRTGRKNPDAINLIRIQGLAGANQQERGLRPPYVTRTAGE